MYSAPTKEDTVHSLKNSVQNIGDKAADAANDAGHDLREAANQAGRKVRGFIDSASHDINHAAESVNTQIHAKPVQSTLVALGVGYVLGRLFRL